MLTVSPSTVPPRGRLSLDQWLREVGKWRIYSRLPGREAVWERKGLLVPQSEAIRLTKEGR